MVAPRTKCLVLACGNPLRGDDGVGPHLAAWAEERFSSNPGIRVLSRQQWTPDLALDIAGADSVLFVDCSIESPPGSIQLRPVHLVPIAQGIATHHVGAPELFALASELYGASPKIAQLLTIGAGSTELREEFSAAVSEALPEARNLLELVILQSLCGSDQRK